MKSTKKKKYKLELVELKGLRLIFSGYWTSFVKINGVNINDGYKRDDLNYDEILAVWNFAVKNRNKLEKLYLEKLLASLKLKEAVEKAIKKMEKSKMIKNGRTDARS